MTDAAIVFLTAGWAGLSVVLVVLCDRLMGGRQ
jgi:hypothetical protein